MALTWLAVTKVTVNVCPHPRAPPGRGPQPRTVDDRRTAVADPGAHEVALTRQLTQSTAQLGFRTNGSAFCLDSCDLARSLRGLISTLEVRTCNLRAGIVNKLVNK